MLMAALGDLAGFFTDYVVFQSFTRNGGAVPVRPHAQSLDTAPALVSEENVKKGRVASAPYVPNKKWKVFKNLKYCAA